VVESPTSGDALGWCQKSECIYCKYLPLISYVLCCRSIMRLIVVSVCAIVNLWDWVSFAPLFGSVYRPITVLNCICYIMFVWWFSLGSIICTVLRGRCCPIVLKNLHRSVCSCNKDIIIIIRCILKLAISNFGRIASEQGQTTNKEQPSWTEMKQSCLHSKATFFGFLLKWPWSMILMYPYRPMIWVNLMNMFLRTNYQTTLKSLFSKVILWIA